MKRRSVRRPFGFVRERPGRPSPYLASYNPPQGGPERTKAFTTEEAADLWLAEQHVTLTRQGYLPIAAHLVTVRDFGERWLAWKAKTKPANTVEKYEIVLRKHAFPTFGDRTLQSVSPEEFRQWVWGLPLSPGTAGNYGVIFAMMFNSAVADGLLARSPAYKVERPRARKRRLRIPTPAEIAAITTEMYRPLRLMVVLATEAGLRQGELLGLREDAVDLRRGHLDVVGQAQTVTGQGVLLDQETKSDAGYRRIPLEEATVEAIEKHLTDHSHPSGLIFTTQTGRPFRRNLANEHWTKARRKAGAPETLRFHDLRHRYASGLIAHGIEPKRVQYLMGHASITETLDTYGHLWPNGDDKVRDAVRRMRD